MFKILLVTFWVSFYEVDETLNKVSQLAYAKSPKYFSDILTGNDNLIDRKCAIVNIT